MAEEKDFIKKINEIYLKLDSIVGANELFDKEVVNRLEELGDLDVALIVDDLKKGNYLGNRKIDIDLSLNNNSLTNHVSYSDAKLVLNDGTILNISFTTLLEDGITSVVLELTSHADIKNYIANDTAYQAQVINTELTVEDAIASTPQMIRFRDADGSASNIDRVELKAYSGEFKKAQLISVWTDTTSSLQTLANRVGDVIALGQRIDKIIALADKEDEIQYLYDTRATIESLALELQKVIDVELKLPEITLIPTQLLQMDNKVTEITNIRNEIKAINPEIVLLAYTESPRLEYNKTTGLFTMFIPQGVKGERGDAFSIDARGTIAERSLYNTTSKDFAYLAVDEVPNKVYFKNSNASGDWSIGTEFGQGETGVSIANIARTSGTGAAGTVDTYTITMSDSGVYTFQVTNGILPTKTDLSLQNVDNTSDSTKNTAIATLTNKTLTSPKINNPTGLKKADVGLSNVDNTTDLLKPISNAAKAVNDTTASSITAIENALNTKSDETHNHDLTYLKLSQSDVFIKPNKGTLFEKVTASSIKIPSGFIVKIGNAIVEKLTDTTITLASNLDMGAKVAGTDYYVYANIDGTFYISVSKTKTIGRLIGGFHYGLTGETESPTGNKLTADMEAIRGINKYSFWDLKYLPTNGKPEGMVCVGAKWYDIYLLNSEHITNGTSKAGATIAGGTSDYGRAIPKIPLEYGGNGTLTYGKLTWFQLCEIATSHGKELISYAEFPTIAYGVNEGKSSATNGYETVAGKIEHYSNLTSKYGIEQATGVQDVWGKDLMNGYGTTDFTWRATFTDGRGNIYGTTNSPTAVRLGGHRGNGVDAGSRDSNWHYYVWGSAWSVGCRLACDHLELD